MTKNNILNLHEQMLPVYKENNLSLDIIINSNDKNNLLTDEMVIKSKTTKDSFYYNYQIYVLTKASQNDAIILFLKNLNINTEANSEHWLNYEANYLAALMDKYPEIVDLTKEQLVETYEKFSPSGLSGDSFDFLNELNENLSEGLSSPPE